MKTKAKPIATPTVAQCVKAMRNRERIARLYAESAQRVTQSKEVTP